MEMKRILLLIVLTLGYAIVIPEIMFRFLSESSYMLLGKLVNPFHIFLSTIDALIIATILLSAFLSWLTLKLIASIAKR